MWCTDHAELGFHADDGPYDLASNNVKEIRAVIGALRVLPTGMKILVSTGSNHVKMGIMEWIQHWQQNGWKNSHGKTVANPALWRALLKVDVGEGAQRNLAERLC
jgi:ribonuclease HI